MGRMILPPARRRGELAPAAAISVSALPPARRRGRLAAAVSAVLAVLAVLLVAAARPRH
jgi:hypothetical protein